MRGTAFVVFKDLQGSTAALRGLDGEGFFGKQLVSVASKLEKRTKYNKLGQFCVSTLGDKLDSWRDCIAITGRKTEENRAELTS